jgi:hypothetical protein
MIQMVMAGLSNSLLYADNCINSFNPQNTSAADHNSIFTATPHRLQLGISIRHQYPEATTLGMQAAWPLELGELD